MNCNTQNLKHITALYVPGKHEIYMCPECGLLYDLSDETPGYIMDTRAMTPDELNRAVRDVLNVTITAVSEHVRNSLTEEAHQLQLVASKANRIMIPFRDKWMKDR